MALVIVPQKDPMRYVEEEISGPDGVVKDMVAHPMTAKEVDEEYAAMIESLGNPKVRIISQDTIPVARGARSARMKSIFTYGDYTRNTYRNDTVHWNRVHDLDMEDGGLYFLLERGSSIKYGDKKITWSASSVMNQLERLVDVVNEHLGLEDDNGYDASNVLGVGAIDIKKFQKHDKWFNLFDLVVEAIPAYKAAAVAASRYENTPNVLGLKGAITKKDFLQYLTTLDEDSTFRQTAEVMIGALKLKNDEHLVHTPTVREFDAFYGKGELREVDSKGYFEDDVLEAYPMLEFVGDLQFESWRRTNLDALFDYIKLIDRS